MDLKNFKVESEAGDTYHISSPSGKKFTVSKKGLSDKAHAMIKKMCAGGSVQAKANGGEIKKYSGEEGSLVTSDDGSAPPVGTNTVLDAPQEQQVMPSAPSAEPQGVPKGFSPTIVPPGDPLIQSGFGQDEILNQQEQGVNSYMSGQDAANKNIQAAYEDEKQKLAAIPTPQVIADHYKAKDDALLQTYMSQQIDPNRYVHNMSTGSKILAAIGLMLSGAGAGRGGTNLAYESLQKAIDHDIAAQQNDQSKSLNIWKMNRESMHDDQQATLATQNQLLTGVQAKIAQAAAQSQNVDAHFRASQMVSQIEQQKLQNRLRLGLLTQGAAQGQGGASGANPLNLVPMLVPAEHQKQAITEIGQAQNAVQNEGGILNLFDQAAKETRPFSNSGINRTALMNTVPGYSPPSIKALNLLYDPLIHDNEGRINELEQKHVQSVSPQWGDSDETIKDKRAALQDFINHKKSAPTAATFGINVQNFNSTKTSTTPQIQYMKGIPFQKVPGGWQRVNK